MMKKAESALKACEAVLEGIECDTITTSSALLQCLRIARLMNDQNSIKWLQYEYGGYPREESGYVENAAWQIAYEHGRGEVNGDGQKVIFTELASEFEAMIVAEKNAISNYSTQGTSVSGDYALGAMTSLTSTVSKSTEALLKRISLHEKRLSILKSRYYDYALCKSIELEFGNVATNIFETYREKVDSYFGQLSSDTLIKLHAIEDKIHTDNVELYSQALTTCRRLFESTAKELFDKYYPGYSDKMYRTKSGKEIDVSGDHYINKLSAVIEHLQNKAVTNTVVGTNIIYIIDWIENLHDLQCKGVHSEVTKQNALQCIIQTYICLGDILLLQENSDKAAH